MAERVLGQELESVVQFLDRPDVQALFERAAQTALTRDSLADIPLPAGLTLSQAEELVGAVNRLWAIRVPLPDFDGRTYWYTTPHDVTTLLRAIDHHCTEGSQLHRAVGGRERRFLVRALVEEAMAQSGLGTAEAQRDDMLALFETDRKPTSDAERVEVNAQLLLAELPGLAEQELTPQLLLAIYERVTGGTAPLSFDGSEIIGGSGAQMTRLEVLKHLCAIANYQHDVLAEHPAITAIVLLRDITYWKPFLRYNNTVARLIFRLHAIRHHYPVLGFLPISTALVEGSAVPHAVLKRYAEIDMTGFITEELRSIQAAIESLRAEVARVEERHEALRSLLQSDPTLNSRQRSILGRALRVPDSTFRIRHHQTTHNLAYSTARADLLELEEKGYLRQAREGKAFVFRATEGLAEKVGWRSIPDSNVSRIGA